MKGEDLTMFKKILVAYDGSDSGKEALTTAIDFLEKNPNSQLDVIHIMDSLPPNAYGLYGPVLARNLVDEFEEAADALLTEAKEIMADYMEVCSFTKLEGNVAEEIVEYADQHHPDLIIIGSRGLGAVKGMLMGSVSSRVVQQVDCHVLVIK